MHKNQESLESLNSEFNHFVQEMKPHVLKHPNKTERQHCALWIKKLCDPATSSLSGHKNRNLHSQMLLNMLKRGVLEGPFASKPQPGSLKNLPTYMSIYFDEPLIGQSVDHRKVTLPDWVSDELDGCDDDSFVAALLQDRLSSSPTTAHTRASHLNEEKTQRGASASSPLKPSPRHETRVVDVGQMSPDDSDLEARLNIWNLGIENPTYSQEKMVPLSPILKSSLGRNRDVDFHLLQNKEVEMRLKVLESKHQEEKLKIQLKHDADVDQILHRRNVEIDEFKSRYRAQQKESEEMIHKLERKVQSVLRESQVTRESKDKQIAELKKMTDQSIDCLKNEWEKKLQAALAEVEKEKFELQKQHTDNIQELLENTKMRLAKMEGEYNARSQATVQTAHELEQQVKWERARVEKGDALLQKVMQEKAQLESRLAELKEANRRMTVLQKDEQGILFQENLKRLQAKHEAEVNQLQQEHALAAAKASEAIEDFEKSNAQLKRQLLVNEHQRQTQVREQDLKFQQEKDELQINYDKKVLALHSEAEKDKTEAKKKIAKLEGALRDMENQQDKTQESHRVHLQQADAALEQFRRQVKLSSEKAEAQLKLQMEKVEEDLQQSRFLREKQSKEFSLQLDALRKKYEQQTISDLEAQLSSLREDLQVARVQHKQQLTDSAALREEERKRFYLTEETLRSDMERTLRDLKRSHQQEKKAAEEKINSRLKHIEKEYNQTLSRSAQVITELQQSACISKEEVANLREAMTRQHEETIQRWAEEKKDITQWADLSNKALQEKVESLQRQLRSSEKTLLSKELESEEKVTAVRQEYEEKIKGLIPVELRQELEDTIASLTAQVNFLQRRAHFLQEDLDACRENR
ncbi:centrosomal protein of 112 kDa isoform X2 [Stigmatopora nigra]